MSRCCMTRELINEMSISLIICICLYTCSTCLDFVGFSGVSVCLHVPSKKSLKDLWSLEFITLECGLNPSLKRKQNVFVAHTKLDKS